MSYWVYLEGEDGKVVDVPRHNEGGTQALGGTREAELNITYNYAEVYNIFDFSIKDLHEMKAEDCIVKLEDLVERLGTKVYGPDYWAPTPGNAGHAVNILLGWARLHPNAIFRVS